MTRQQKAAVNQLERAFAACACADLEVWCSSSGSDMTVTAVPEKVADKAMRVFDESPTDAQDAVRRNGQIVNHFGTYTQQISW